MTRPFPSPAEPGRLQWRDKGLPEKVVTASSEISEWIGGSSPDPDLLYEGDNLHAMSDLLERGFENRFQLVYLDPPFCSGRDYKKAIRLHGDAPKKGPLKTTHQITQYTDTWDEDTYLQFCFERLVLLRSLLHPNGSLVLHVDEHMSHMLRCVLDEVFGRSNFVNEIVWHYPDNFQGNVRGLANNHNLLFWYRKTPNFKANPVRIPLDKPTKRDRRVWDKALKKVVAARDEDGKIIYDIYTDKKADDVWRIGQSAVSKTRSHEHTGYPTQKPELLLQRIIEATTDAGDWVFDPFCGSGTTATVSHKLGRRWASCDMNRVAIHTLSNRLQKIVNYQDKLAAEPRGGVTIQRTDKSTIALVQFPDHSTERSAGTLELEIEGDSREVVVELIELVRHTHHTGDALNRKHWANAIDAIRIDADYNGLVFKTTHSSIPGAKEVVALKHVLPRECIGTRFAMCVVDVFGNEFRHEGDWPNGDA